MKTKQRTKMEKLVNVNEHEQSSTERLEGKKEDQERC